MKRLTIIIVFSLVALNFSLSTAQPLPFRDTTISVEKRVDDLISRLTLEEKIAFLEHQNPAVERLGIKPYSWWNEALHGVGRNGLATVYPMPIALAATFNPLFVEDVYAFIANEAVRKHQESQAAGNYGDYTGLTFFTPNINIFRDPRWGRGMETFGEDPFLTAQMGLAAVQGLQGEGRLSYQSDAIIAAACLKHFAVHSGPEGLRHQFDSRVSHRDLWTTYLPAFEYIIKHSNVQQVMCGYNRLNGEPCCTNHHLLTDILRNRWHYDGILVTDCWALNDCWERDTVIPRHRTHPTAARAAAAAFGTEVDLECGSGLAALKTAVDSGYITEQKIDEHLRRLLRTRLRIQPDKFETTMESSDDQMAFQAASESLVLLKNNGTLPIRKLGRIAILGPNAADSAMALGNYNGTPDHQTTIYQGFKNILKILNTPENEFVTGNPFKSIYFDTACHLADKDYKLPKGFWEEVSKCDAIVFCGGLSPALEGEELQVEMTGFHKGDRTRIELPEAQSEMIKALHKKTKKPIILVLCTGSAIALEEVVDDVDAIVVAWYGGQEMGDAVALSLTGLSNNFGRLPVTFYRATAQLPDFENYDMQGRTYRYMDEEPLYAFGDGLSYSHFSYSDISFDRENMTLSATLSLDGVMPGCQFPEGKEVVQVYLSSPTDSKGPRRQLVAVENYVLGMDAEPNPYRFSIKIDPFWLRHYDEESDSMVLPAEGTPFKLEIKGGPSIEFKW